MSVVFIPKGLDLGEILQNRPPAFKFHTDEIKYIIGTIVRLKTQHKDYLESEYVPLSASILQSKIRAYNKILTYLIEQGIIETDYYFKLGEKCRGYKLTTLYATQGYRIEELTKHSLVRRRALDRQKERALREYRHLTKWFNNKLQIDRDGAISCLEELRDKETAEGDKLAREKYYLRLMTIEKLNKGFFHYNVDATGKRFHSNLTNMKSILRGYITYDGQQLCSIDIKNSQPFISAIFFKREFYNKESEGLNLYAIAKEFYEKAKNVERKEIKEIREILNDVKNIITLVKTDLSQCHSDIELYLTLVDKGLLYPFISDRLYEQTGRKLSVEIPAEKGELKSGVFQSLYGNGYLGDPRYDIKRLFPKMFPTVNKIFSLIKRGGHEKLAITLQLIESEIILTRASRYISKTFPKLPIFTIHDCIVTLAEYKETVKNILKTEFERAIGLVPSVSFEMWQQ